MYEAKWYLSVWFISLMFFLSILLVPFFVGIVLLIVRIKEESEAKRKWEERGFDKLVNTADELDNLKNHIVENRKKLNKDEEEHKKKLKQLSDKTDKDLESRRNSIEELKNRIKGLDDIIKEKEYNIDLLNGDLEILSHGFSEPDYGFESSEIYQGKLKEIKDKQKEMVKKKIATNHSLEWHISGDKKKGKEFILDTVKLTLRAFNNECDNIITKVKHSNLEQSDKKINKLFEDLNKLTDMQNVSIKKEYLNLKLEELYLKHGFEVKKMEEKEEQKEIRERMKEEEKARRELEKEMKKVEKEEKHYIQAIENERERIEKLSDDDEEKKKLEDKIKELESKLNNVTEDKKNIDNRARNQKAGYVYVISNIGSFGENVYKIGMTRRLDPSDRIKELSSASVPFSFDVHAMVFSEDAPKLESELHRAFEDKRVNKINNRKEFFKVSLDDIEKEVRENHDKVVEFTKLAKADDWRQTIEIEKKLKKRLEVGN